MFYTYCGKFWIYCDGLPVLFKFEGIGKAPFLGLTAIALGSSIVEYSLCSVDAWKSGIGTLPPLFKDKGDPFGVFYNFSFNPIIIFIININIIVNCKNLPQRQFLLYFRPFQRFLVS